MEILVLARMVEQIIKKKVYVFLAIILGLKFQLLFLNFIFLLLLLVRLAWAIKKQIA